MDWTDILQKGSINHTWIIQCVCLATSLVGNYSQGSGGWWPKRSNRIQIEGKGIIFQEESTIIYPQQGTYAVFFSILWLDQWTAWYQDPR